MNKRLFLLFFLFCILIVVSFFAFQKLNKKNVQSTDNSKVLKNELNLLDKQNLVEIEQKIKNENLNQSQEDVSKKARIELLKKRFALRSMISSWNELFDLWQYDKAIETFEEILKENPEDEKIIRKLAFSYFKIKDFDKAVFYYEKMLSFLDEEDKKNYILSLIYRLNKKDLDNIKKTWDKIKNLSLSLDEKIYYINSLECLINKNLCVKNFEKYFEKNKEIKFEPLLEIKNSIKNFENFWSEEPYYKNTLITWAFYKNKLYTISISFWEKVLSKFPDYNPILFIVGTSYYEIADYNNAKSFLLKYYEKNSNDEKVSYLLWDINFKLWDYVASNMYYQASLKNNFKNALDIQRKLAYNYYLLWDKKSMLNVFSNIIDDENSTIDDFSLWIYWSIIEWKNLTRIKWSKKWIKKFENNNWYEIFYWYLWWVYREEKDLEKREEYLKIWYNINPKNPLLLLNYWYLELEKENYKKAIIYFKRTKIINWNWEFWELASKEIKEIEDYFNLNK